jgi:hypothetical protein
MRGRRRWQASWVFAVAVFLAGCAAEASPTPAESAFFPRHASPLGTGDQALIEGQVVFADGCVWVQPSATERFLVLWPSNTTLGKINNLPAVLGSGSELLVETGSVTRLAGGSTDLETARNLVGNIPEQCSTNGFWVASDVDNRP